MSPVQTSGAVTSAATTATSLSSLQQLLTQLTRTNVSGSMTAINPAIQSMLASTLGRMGNITALGKSHRHILILTSHFLLITGFQLLCFLLRSICLILFIIH